MFYTNILFIKAHEDLGNPYRNHSYDREVRHAYCKKCHTRIGEQVKYEIQTEFSFGCEKDNYTHCPYCGHKFKKGKSK